MCWLHPWLPPPMRGGCQGKEISRPLSYARDGKWVQKRGRLQRRRAQKKRGAPGNPRAPRNPRFCGEKGESPSRNSHNLTDHPCKGREMERGKKFSRESGDSREIWRRSRDLNPGDGIPSYSLSRGAPSASWVLLQIAVCLAENGGERGIRTPGALRHHWFSRPAP